MVMNVMFWPELLAFADASWAWEGRVFFGQGAAATLNLLMVG